MRDVTRKEWGEFLRDCADNYKEQIISSKSMSVLTYSDRNHHVVGRMIVTANKLIRYQLKDK